MPVDRHEEDDSLLVIRECIGRFTDRLFPSLPRLRSSLVDASGYIILHGRSGPTTHSPLTSVDSPERVYRGREALLSGTRRSLLQAFLEGSLGLVEPPRFDLCLEEFIKLRSCSPMPMSASQKRSMWESYLAVSGMMNQLATTKGAPGPAKICMSATGHLI